MDEGLRDMIRDIGSIFPIRSVSPAAKTGRTLKSLNRFGDVRLFSMCRECLAWIGKRYGTSSRRVLLPAYTCDTVIRPFSENGWTCEYYSITPQLRIDPTSFEDCCKRFKPNVIIVHPYYGAELNAEEISLLKSMKSPDSVMVQDVTQCIFTNLADNIFDYTVGSLRKWFPVPDGAFIASHAHSLESSVPQEENSSYIAAELAAMHLRYQYFESGDETIKMVSRTLDKMAQGYIDDYSAQHLISKYSAAELSAIDFDEVATARIRNYRYLLENVKSDQVKPIAADMRAITSAPLYFPVLCGDRDAILKRLLPARIYAPILWPLPNEDVLVSEDVRTLYSALLAIPIDQRCKEDDMGRICEVLNG